MAAGVGGRRFYTPRFPKRVKFCDGVLAWKGVRKSFVWLAPFEEISLGGRFIHNKEPIGRHLDRPMMVYESTV